MNFPFWKNVQNKDPTSYEALLEMMERDIINEELEDHHNKANKGLSPFSKTTEESTYLPSNGPSGQPFNHP